MTARAWLVRGLADGGEGLLLADLREAVHQQRALDLVADLFLVAVLDELATLSGVPRPTIANLESGSANPTLGVLVRIASSLQVSIEQLIAAWAEGSEDIY